MGNWKEWVCLLYLAASLGLLRIICARAYGGIGDEFLFEFEIDIIEWAYGNMNQKSKKCIEKI